MKFKTKFYIILILFIAFVALNWNTVTNKLGEKDFTSITGNLVQQVPYENSSDTQLYFCPQDNCADKLITWIDIAEESVDCALFDIGLDELKNELIKKNKEVPVRVVVDNNYYEKVKELDFVRNDSKQGLMHNKFCIIDGYIVWTGSFNPTTRGKNYNNNNALVYVSKYLGKNYEDEFEELWTGKYGKGTRVRYKEVHVNNKTVKNYFCPEDWCADKIIKEIATAKKSVHFMTFSFTSEEIARELITANDRGVEVTGVMEKSQGGSKYSQYYLLAASGINVNWDKNKYNMHHKVFIIDSSVVITGSMNPTKSGDTKNDENILIIYDEDVAEKFIDEFNRLRD